MTRNSVTSWAVDSPPRATTAVPATAVSASRPCSSSPARRPIRLAVSELAARRACTCADSSAHRRSRWAWPRLARRSSRAATPSSMAAARVGPGDLLGQLAPGDLRRERPHQQQRPDAGEREEHPRRCPGQSGDDPHRDGAQQRADEVPGDPAQQRPELVGVVVDPVEHLADSLLREHRERLVQRRLEQVGPQPPLGPVDQTGPDRPRRGVERGRPDDAQREQRQQRARGPLGQPARDDRPQRLPDRGGAGARERPPRHRPAQPLEADPPGRVDRRRGSRGAGPGGVEEGHRPRRYVPVATAFRGPQRARGGAASGAGCACRRGCRVSRRTGRRRRRRSCRRSPARRGSAAGGRRTPGRGCRG